jgi:pyruvate kinase
MARISSAADAEQARLYHRDARVPRGQIDDHISQETCDLACAIGAQAIVAPTQTGRTPRLIARHRPPLAILAVASAEATLRRLAIVWGVRAVPMTASGSEDRLEAAVRAAFVHGGLKAGDLAVVVAGHPVEGAGYFPSIRVVRVGAGGRSESP